MWLLTPPALLIRILTICPVGIPSLASTIIAVYLGSSVALVLYGITNLQTFLYYKRYTDDWWFYRYSVAVLWMFDTLHVLLSTHALYFYLIESFGNYLGLINIVWSFKLDVVINNLVSVPNRQDRPDRFRHGDPVKLVSLFRVRGTTTIRSDISMSTRYR
ncbi:hypothetical protein IW261DRAFT_904711 [Armillaria novae-zelandiae]|uniref:Uncharacterized protein n=1 Tax=Armillaria novae-zelandiae TaxID=153914 RepID=A0AA39T878_9AGAR|nr:hypothetical protein IW261DRAFT_904711 [Armillaria novae-zelandiae]